MILTLTSIYLPVSLCLCLPVSLPDGSTADSPSVLRSIQSQLPANFTHLNTGRFERAVSMFRTSYSIAVQSKSGTAITWFAPGAPHASVFAPIFVKASDVPRPLRRGSLFQLSHDSMWWAVTRVANWMRSNVFMLAKRDVKRAQREIEAAFYDALLPFYRNATIPFELDQFYDYVGTTILQAWHRLFDSLVVKYRDGYVLSMENGHSAHVEPDVRRHFYPEWWLNAVSFYSPDKPDHYYFVSSLQAASRSMPHIAFFVALKLSLLIGLFLGVKFQSFRQAQARTPTCLPVAARTFSQAAN